MPEDGSKDLHSGASLDRSGRLLLTYSSFREFMEQCMSSLSEQGMFVESKRPLPVGSEVDFELRVGEDFELFKGKGLVSWTREASPGEAQTPGMALRFLKIEEPGRRLLDRVLRKFRDEGRPLFEIEQLAMSGALTEDEEELPAETPDPPETSQDDGASIEGAPIEETLIEEPLIEETLIEEPLTGAAVLGVLSSGDSSAEEAEVGEPPVDDVSGEQSPLDDVRVQLAKDEEDLLATALEGQALDPPDPTLEEFLRSESLPGDLSGSAPLDTEKAHDVARLEELPAGVGPDDLGEAEILSPPGLDTVEEPVEVEADSDAAFPWAGAQSESSRTVLWILLLILVVLAGVAGYFYRDSLMGIVGMDSKPSGQEPPASGVEPVEPTSEPSAAEPSEGIVSGVGSPEVGAESPIALEPFTSIEQITWRREQGGTLLVLEADGTVPQTAIEAVLLESGQPRVLIKVTGLANPYTGGGILVNSPELVSVRTGMHDEGGAWVLHVVADLTGAEVELTSAGSSGSEVQILLRAPRD